MNDFQIEWAYFLEADRLNHGLSRGGNAQGILLARQTNEIALNNGRVLPRAYGLLSFMILNRWLSNWSDPADAKSLLENAIADLRAAADPKGGIAEPERRPVEVLVTLERLNSGQPSPDETIIGTIAAYAATAVKLDPNDNDTHWSMATANLYSGNFGDAFAGYETAMTIADLQKVPDIDKGTLRVDYADALFFAGSGADQLSKAEHAAAIKQAIETTKSAIAQNGSDPKRRRWNWTLGWAYYELAYYEDAEANAATSLSLLQELRNPHHLICKNLMASYVATEQIGFAKELADKFKKNNPGYTLAVEDRWPYRNPAQRERWKNDLEKAGLPRK